MKDITDEMTQLQRGFYFLNCDRGVLRGGKSDGQTYVRTSSSETMKSNGETYYRSGRIEEDKNNQPHVVYQFKEKKKKNENTT